MKRFLKKLTNRIKNKGTNGITLIALVITIIVLLILAGISISMLSGDNSILKRAAEAKEKTDEAINNEEIALKYMEANLMEGWNGNIATDFSGGTGTENDPFKISNAEELAYFASLVNSGRDFTGEYVEIIKNINLGNKEFIPAGGYVDKNSILDEDGEIKDNFFELGKSFNGTLDGNNNVITGININNENKACVGLIGMLGNQGFLKNIIVDEGNIKGYALAGGIVGTSNGTIQKCINSASVNAKFHSVGGIIGYQYLGNIKKCVNNGKIFADQYRAGGIIGQIVKGNLHECINYGEILSNGTNIGGIVGIARNGAEVNIQSCINYGKVFSANRQCGGIIGHSLGNVIKINECINYGEISTGSGSYVGGIAGILGDSEGTGIVDVEKCKNYGKIISETQCSAGIVARLNCGTIKECSNYGEVSSKNINAGGIVAMIPDNCDNITRCINYGKITAYCQSVGGIVGRIKNGKINYCSNYGEVFVGEHNGSNSMGILGGVVGACQSDVEIDRVANFGKIACIDNPNKLDCNGGIIGYIVGGKKNTLTNSYNKGIVEGGESIGEIIGYNKVSEAVSNCFYYKREDSNLQGIGASNKTEDEYFSGTTGDIEFNYDSLDEFLSEKVSN